MTVIDVLFAEKPRLPALLDHVAAIKDPREPWRVAQPLPEVLLLVVCGTMADCDDADAIAAFGEMHLPFLRRCLPYHFGVPGGRWLTLLMNRINPALFSAAFTAGVRPPSPDRPDRAAIAGKTSRRSHGRATHKGPLHLVSAFATPSRLVLGEASSRGQVQRDPRDPRSPGAAGRRRRLEGRSGLHRRHRGQFGDRGGKQSRRRGLSRGGQGQPAPLRAGTESVFGNADPASLESIAGHDKGHGRIDERTVSAVREGDWLDGDRRFRGERRLPGAASIIRVKPRTELSGRGRFETRSSISPAPLTAARAVEAARGHWGIENRLHSSARRRLRRRSLSPQKRRWCKKHGRRQAIRHQSHPIRKG